MGINVDKWVGGRNVAIILLLSVGGILFAGRDWFRQDRQPVQEATAKFEYRLQDLEKHRDPTTGNILLVPRANPARPEVDWNAVQRVKADSDSIVADKWVVVTTINAPTDAIKAIVAQPGWRLVVVGDTKTPKDWAYEDAIFLDVEKQKTLGYRIHDLIPYRSYARKNIGYMYAIQHGAKVVYETDDDNLLLVNITSGFDVETLESSRLLQYKRVEGRSVVNPYVHFGQPSIWPRGYPLRAVEANEPEESYLAGLSGRQFIQQGLANGDPDVDAIFRLTRRTANHLIRVEFDAKAPPVALPKGLITPFNSQNTLFHAAALWGLLIPVTTSFRVCDIWRGYWAQRLLWEVGGTLAFYPPSVRQDRNIHNFFTDYLDEEAFYKDADRLVSFLEAWKSSSENFFDKALDLSYAMAVEGFWQQGDVELTAAWLQDLLAVGYEPPKMQAEVDPSKGRKVTFKPEVLKSSHLLPDTVEDPSSSIQAALPSRPEINWDSLEPLPLPAADSGLTGGKWVVVTTINPPTEAIQVLAALPGWRLVVVGDTKTPPDWNYGSAVFLSVEAQKGLGYAIHDLLPYRSYARKNIGYLYAIQHGAKVVYETDDDNILIVDLNKGFDVGDLQSDRMLQYERLANRSLVNPYVHFGQPSMWPRGYPLHAVEDNGVEDGYLGGLSGRQYIQQGLANGDPDVDAIFRLTRRTANKLIRVQFDSSAPPVSLPQGIITPFNSQNTLFHAAALWGLLIPVTTSFRVCDIWRGYWAQRLLWEVGGTLAFYPPSVRQDRNIHNFFADFLDEEALYKDAGRLVEFLQSWRSEAPHMFDRVLDLSYGMAKEGFWEAGDVALAAAWLQDLVRVGYKVPALAQAQDQSGGQRVHFQPQVQKSSHLLPEAAGEPEAVAPLLERPQIDWTALTPMDSINKDTEPVSDKWVVVTTINAPTEAIQVLAALPGWRLVVVGDTKTPPDWNYGSAVFLSVEAQKGLGYAIHDLLPYRSYARKNIGYLYAIQHGAKVVYETDDDNILIMNITKGFDVDNLDSGRLLQYERLANRSLVNPYVHYGQPSMWPRGYPLHAVEVNGEEESYLRDTSGRQYIQQGLANGDPDVDAIFRLTRRPQDSLIRVEFDATAPPVALPQGLMTPFNSQNTLFHAAALWGLLIPVTTSFRVCDIWRGYWAQRLLWEVGGTLAFYPPSVRQDRNIHNFFADFLDEAALYKDAGRLVEFLQNWRSDAPHLFDRVLDLSYGMAKEGFWEAGDVALAAAWLQDLVRVGYKVPGVAEAAVLEGAERVHFRPQPQKSSHLFSEPPRMGQLEAWRAAFRGVTLVIRGEVEAEGGACDQSAFFWRLVYRRVFRSVAFVCPKATANGNGTAQGIPVFPSVPEALAGVSAGAGYLILRDDTLLNYWTLGGADVAKLWVETRTVRRLHADDVPKLVLGEVKSALRDLQDVQLPGLGTKESKSPLYTADDGAVFIPALYVAAFSAAFKKLSELTMQEDTALPVAVLLLAKKSGFDSAALRNVTIVGADDLAAGVARLYTPDVALFRPWRPASQADLTAILTAMAAGDDSLMLLNRRRI